ncbi:MAG: hypothetical protein HQM03_01665 [Magnetococcales bacterium]|nr:hypothetical protein [Magnetococcales bacterium]
MNPKFLTSDLTQLDPLALEKIARIAEQARHSLLMGIATIRHMDDPAESGLGEDSDQMVAQLGHLTLMWDEIFQRASQLLHDADGAAHDPWPESNPPVPPVTLH